MRKKKIADCDYKNSLFIDTQFVSHEGQSEKVIISNNNETDSLSVNLSVCVQTHA